MRRTLRRRRWRRGRPGSSGGRWWTPRLSVDSQIGPSTRDGSRFAGRSCSTGRPSDVSATIAVAGAIERRPDQLRHPRIEDDLPAPALADVKHPGDEPARAGDQEPAWFDREAGRRRSAGSPGGPGISRANRAGPRRRARRRRRPGSRRRDRACRSRRSHHARARRPPQHAGRRRATHRPHRAASRRGGGSRAGRSGPGGRLRPRSRSAISASVIPNFEPPAPTARPGRVSGATSGFSRRGRRAAALPADAPTSVSEVGRLLG